MVSHFECRSAQHRCHFWPVLLRGHNLRHPVALSGCGCICSCACHIFRSGLSVLSCDGWSSRAFSAKRCASSRAVAAAATSCAVCCAFPAAARHSAAPAPPFPQSASSPPDVNRHPSVHSETRSVSRCVGRYHINIPDTGWLPAVTVKRNLVNCPAHLIT